MASGRRKGLFLRSLLTNDRIKSKPVCWYVIESGKSDETVEAARNKMETYSEQLASQNFSYELHVDLGRITWDCIRDFWNVLPMSAFAFFSSTVMRKLCIFILLFLVYTRNSTRLSECQSTALPALRPHQRLDGLHLGGRVDQFLKTFVPHGILDLTPEVGKVRCINYGCLLETRRTARSVERSYGRTDHTPSFGPWVLRASLEGTIDVSAQDVYSDQMLLRVRPVEPSRSARNRLSRNRLSALLLATCLHCVHVAHTSSRGSPHTRSSLSTVPNRPRSRESTMRIWCATAPRPGGRLKGVIHNGAHRAYGEWSLQDSAHVTALRWRNAASWIRRVIRGAALREGYLPPPFESTPPSPDMEWSEKQTCVGVGGYFLVNDPQHSFSVPRRTVCSESPQVIARHMDHRASSDPDISASPRVTNPRPPSDAIEMTHSPGLPRDLDDQIIGEIARGLYDSVDPGRREEDCSLLRSLELSVSIPGGFPSLPNMLDLTLHRIEFLDWAAFETFMSSFPALRDFQEFNVLFTRVTQASGRSSILRDLRSLRISSAPYFIRELAAHPLLADNLRLDLPIRLTAPHLQYMSDYLRKLDSRLKYLHISVPDRWSKFLGVSLQLDMRLNTALRGLTMDHFVQCHMSEEETKVGFNADMVNLLSHVGSQCPIEALVLEVVIIQEGTLDELSFGQFEQKLEAPSLRNVSSITFCIRERFRLPGVEYWPTNLKEILRAEFLRYNPRRALYFDLLR
ncbi:hypothetical protein B0H11DRAFT_1909068 [Mycena galericulata]|nr:hypothetical protein B0H11DRAFT_1909068 [Mycena galericulata]